MNSSRLIEESRSLAKEKGLKCTVLGLPELKKLGMNGLLAVNQGSVTPPALIILEHGEEHKAKGTVCLVGKGVTFDTGGISIKPSKGMEEMKFDKSGAIAVIATLGLLADLKLPLHVVGLAPCVENNVANDPQRPGDIIRMYNGKTVEVVNTDAEGRLILADALSYCEKFKPVAIIDAATLTGLCHYTFGDKACAILGTDQKLIDVIREAGEKPESVAGNFLFGMITRTRSRGIIPTLIIPVMVTRGRLRRRCFSKSLFRPKFRGSILISRERLIRPKTVTIVLRSDRIWGQTFCRASFKLEPRKLSQRVIYKKTPTFKTGLFLSGGSLKFFPLQAVNLEAGACFNLRRLTMKKTLACVMILFLATMFVTPSAFAKEPKNSGRRFYCLPPDRS